MNLKSKLARINLNLKIKKIIREQGDLETLYLLRQTITEEIVRKQKEITKIKERK